MKLKTCFFLIFVWYFTGTAGAINWTSGSFLCNGTEKDCCSDIEILWFVISSRHLMFNAKPLQAFPQLVSPKTNSFFLPITFINFMNSWTEKKAMLSLCSSVYLYSI